MLRRTLFALGDGSTPGASARTFTKSRTCHEHGLVDLSPDALVWHAFDGRGAAVSRHQPVGLGPVWTIAAATVAQAEALIAAMCRELHLVRSGPDPDDTLP